MTDDARTARLRAPANAGDLDPRFATRTANARAWRGLETLAVYLQARRELLYQRFLEMWTRLERDGFRARLQYAATERPTPVTGPSQDGNGDARRVRIASPAALR